MRVGVLAVGNRFAGDDAVGPLVLDAVQGRLPSGVVTAELDGEPSRVLDAWDGLDAVVVVDAACSGAPVGTVHRFELGDDAGALRLAPRVAGTHGAGVAEAVALGGVLGRRPAQVLVVAVEGRAFAAGAGLTPEVGRALPAAAATVLDEVVRLAAVPA